MYTKFDIKQIIKYLKSNGIYIDFDEFQFQIESHPDFNSLLAYSDGLTFSGIENYVFSISNDKIDLLPDKFMAIINCEDEKGEFTNSLNFIEKNNGVYKYTLDGKKRVLDKAAFIDNWNNTILLIDEVPEQKKSIKYWYNSLLFIIAIALFIYYAIVTKTNFNTLSASLILFSITGIIFSIETFKQALGIKSVISSAICSGNQIIDCDSVYQSSIEKFKFLERFSLSDISIVFFSSQLITVLFATFFFTNEKDSFYSFIYFSLVIATPFTLASIFYQWKLAKKWCTLCLTIILILYLELFFLHKFFIPTLFSLVNPKIALILSIHLTILFLWILFGGNFKQNKKLKGDVTKLNQFKYNYLNFKNNLLASKKSNEIDINDSGVIILGNPNANFTLTIITNPFCSHCATFHPQIEELLKKYNNSVKINLYFLFLDQVASDDSKIVHYNLLSLYLKDKENFLKALSSWFKNKEVESWSNKFATNKSNFDVEKEILQKQLEWCRENEMHFTPILCINNYRLPETYNREDLKFFIMDLVDDSEFNKMK